LEFLRHFITLVPKQALALLFGVDVDALLLPCIALLSVAGLIVVRTVTMGRASAETRGIQWLVLASLMSLPVVSGSSGSITRALLIPSIGGCVAMAVLVQHGWRIWRRRVVARNGLEWLAFSFAGIAAATLVLFVHLSLARGLYAKLGAPDRPPSSTGAIELLPSHDVVALATPLGPMHSRWGGFLHWFMTGQRMRHWWVITSAPEPGLMRVSRTSSRALEVLFPDDGALLSDGQRSFERDPMQVGDEITMDGLRIRVLGCRRGAPYRIEISSHRSLDDRSLAFLAWQSDGFRRVSLPPPGGSALIRDLVPARSAIEE
jgi:hypothetical protein